MHIVDGPQQLHMEQNKKDRDQSNITILLRYVTIALKVLCEAESTVVRHALLALINNHISGPCEAASLRPMGDI